MSTRPDEEQTPDAAPGVVAVHVHGVLDGGAIGGPLLVRRQRREADDNAIDVPPDDVTAVGHGHDGAERAGPGGQPRPLVVERPGDEIERRRAAR